MRPVNPIWRKGSYAKQAHRSLPPETFEREVGQCGFDGPATHFYHKHPPTSWSDIRGPLRPRAFNLSKLPDALSFWELPCVLKNDHLRVSFGQIQIQNHDLFRNADGDLLVFVHVGQGELYCDYGRIEFKTGDYLVIPRGTMMHWRHEEAVKLFVVEATHQHLRLPDRGLLGQHALFDEACIEIPELDSRFLAEQAETRHSVFVKKANALTRLDFDFNPLDTIGWKGSLSVWKVNVADFLPINSHRYHLPPSVHATVETDRFLISTFVPRPFETDREALKVPFFHSNEDIDEVLFYHAGNFFSRDNIDIGTLTVHPAGLPHGPHPNAQQNMFNTPQPRTDEVAVMIDALDPIHTSDIDDQVQSISKSPAVRFNPDVIELANYAYSWRTGADNGSR